MSEQAAQPGQQAEGQAKPDLRLMIEQVAKVLVDVPDEVYVDAEQERGTTVLFLEVAPQDVGKIIGKQGRTARALRTLLEAAAAKQHARYELEIVEDDEEEDDEPDGNVDSEGAQA